MKNNNLAFVIFIGFNNIMCLQFQIKYNDILKLISFQLIK
jgi:hypothetical protein